MVKSGRRKIEALTLRRKSKEREVNNFQEREKFTFRQQHTRERRKEK